MVYDLEHPDILSHKPNNRLRALSFNTVGLILDLGYMAFEFRLPKA